MFYSWLNNLGCFETNVQSFYVCVLDCRIESGWRQQLVAQIRRSRVLPSPPRQVTVVPPEPRFNEHDAEPKREEVDLRSKL